MEVHTQFGAGDGNKTFFFLTLRSVKYISKRRFMRNPGRANAQVRMQKKKTGGRV